MKGVDVFARLANRVKPWPERITQRLAVPISLALVVAIGIGDLITGVEPSFTLLYVLPIWIAAKHTGRRFCLALAVLATLFRIGATHPHPPIIMVWNAIAVFSVLTIIAMLLVRLHELVAREQGRLGVAVAQLRHAERLNVIGTLAAGVAHEVGTPLNVITLSAQRLSDPQLPRGRADQLIGMIIGQAAKIGAIVRHLLEFGRRTSSERTDVELCELAQRTAELVATAAHRYHCRVEVSGEAPVRVHANAPELEQVISNLLLNAMQAMPNGGPVRVTTSTAKRTDDHGVERVLASVAVADDGTGIAEEDVPHIFDPFYTTKPVGEGTGLGLSVSYGIVAELGGTIEVQSQRGRGTTFTVLLPTV